MSHPASDHPLYDPEFDFGDDLSDEEAAYRVELVGSRVDAATVELLDFPSAIAARETGRSPAESPVAGRSSGWGAMVLWIGLAMSLGGVVLGGGRLKDLIREGPRTNYGVILGQGSVRGDLGLIRGDRGWVGYRMGSEGWNGGTSGGTIFLSSPGAKFVDVVGFGEVHGRIEEMETRGLGVALRGESAWTATSLLVAAGLVQSTLWAIALGLAVMRRRAAWACLVLMACGDLVEAAIWLQLETWHATAVGSLAFPILMLLVLTRPEVRAYFDPAFDPSPPETVKLAKPGRSQAWADLA
ncbi:hypothetical protein [Planctomyces sp. SH-PL62]|uniref:hypothetical protein n=1 Tax=Planctomyces sp. SH-PL62 TaxID=1636152 RepID=UPI00078BE92B|nr:hypothetical protein [Planctomyces sp. SH-PL62]AMV39879.1 hypothetical protein VT85_20775 [Planctomyces sp. SH-PL62]